MAILSWGKFTLQHSNLNASGAKVGGWITIDTPKEGSGVLTPTAGDEVEAREEGGELVDSRRAKNRYTFEWDNFVKKGVALPFSDEDGVVAGEHAIRVIPEDNSCVGILIDRCTITVQVSYTSADGMLLHYTAKALKPNSGKMVKLVVANSGATNYQVVTEPEPDDENEWVEEVPVANSYYYYSGTGTIDDNNGGEA